MLDEYRHLIFGSYAVERETVGSSRYQWNCFDRGKEPFVILQYTFEGTGCFSSRGKTHEVPAGSAFISLVPEQARYFYPAESREPWTFCWLNFYGGLSLDLWGSLRRRFGPVIHLPPASAMAAQLAGLARKIALRKFADRYEASAESYAFYVNCLRELSQPGQARLDPVSVALQIYRNHFRDPVSTKELAAQCHLSREHFSRIFKERQGISPAAYLRGQRLQAAAEMLRLTPLPLKEVALRTGFYSARHLMKAFMRLHGETPHRYRRRKLKRVKARSSP